MATTKPIQSLERAFSILELLGGEESELSIKEISDALGLNKSTVFGSINTLMKLGYLIQNPKNQRYSLGMKILSLANSVKTNNVIIMVTHPYLEELSRRFQETTHCATRQNNGIIYLDKVEAHRSIYINTQIGTKNYLHCTGVGKCILAYMRPEELELFLAGGLRTMTYNTITNIERLKEELHRVAKLGFAEDNEETELGLSCVAVPVFDAPNHVSFAISVSGLTQRMQSANKLEMVDALQTASSAISYSVYGYRPTTEFKLNL